MLAVAQVIAVLAPLAACRSSGPAAFLEPDVSWVMHRAGAYVIPSHDLARAAAAGLDLSITAPDKKVTKAARQPRWIIDPTIAGLITQFVPPKCKDTRQPCVLTSSQRRSILGKVEQHLASLAGNTRVRGIYLIDDYPGNIASLIREVARLVAKSNQKQGVRRATVCPFLAPLDTIDPGRPDAPATEYHDFLDRALLNYSPSACDIVAAYSYSALYVPSDHVDWTMRTMLPYIRDSLMKRGWNPAAAPLIGIPQAFGYGTEWFAPKPDQLRTEIGAFCRGGASAIVGYAWDDGHQGDRSELGDNAALREAFARGIDDCRSMWRAVDSMRGSVTSTAG